jgi:hypothetical protein
VSLYAPSLGLHDAHALSTFTSSCAVLSLAHQPQSPLCAAETVNSLLLVLSKPRLGRFTHHSLAKVIHKVADHNQCECDWIHPVHVQVKHLQADNDTPEVASQKGNVLERCTGEAVQDRYQGVEDEEDQGVACKIATNLAIPGRVAEAGAVEDAGLCAVDEGGPEPELADDLVQRPLGDEPFFIDVAQTVECSAQKGEQVAFELVAGGHVATIRTSDVVRSQQQTHATNTDKDAKHLSPVVADLEKGKGEDDHDNNGPEVDQLRRENRRVSICQNGEVVAFDVEESEDDIYYSLVPNF